jgi:uncharacterized ion transporter superfamily protein YfcC
MSNSNEKSFSSISVKSFVTVVALLLTVLFVAGALSYFIPTGSFDVDENGSIIPGTYQKGEIRGIAVWRVLTAPVRVFASEDAVTIIMISIFLLIMSGVFNLLEKTDGIKVFIGRLMKKLAKRGGPVVCLSVLVFMLFGSFFGMFEELVTLVPLMVILMLSLGMDTMTGLGACMLAACFGFSAAITNPFSVGLAASVAGVPALTGAWLRIIFFGIIYLTLCCFLMMHLRKIERDPTLSLTYESDVEKKKNIGDFLSHVTENEEKVFKIYSVFFSAQIFILVLIASIRAISGFAIPILSASFLIGGIICGLMVSDKKRNTFKYLYQGAVSMLPAVLMIALASSVKLVMTESEIIDTVMNFAIRNLENKNKFVAIILVYLLILFLQMFIGSASAKIMLVMPIVMPICSALGLSPAIVILAYCMADGFTDVIIPTNPILLVGLSMANVSYGKWVKWTWKLQLTVFVMTILILFLAVAIGY